MRREPSIGEMIQEPAGRTDRLTVPIHEFDAANDATITLLDHPHRGILRPHPHSTGEAQRLPGNDPDKNLDGHYSFHQPDLGGATDRCATRTPKTTNSPHGAASEVMPGGQPLVWRGALGVGVVVCQVAAQLTGGFGLREEFPGLGLGPLDGVRAGDETRRRLVLVGDGQQSP
jgi:hypothetical protein